MINFIKPKKASVKRANKLKVEKFISMFNKAIAKHKFCLNTGLDHIPYLGEAEFELAKNQAKKNGYILTHFEDNYQTDSYKLEAIKPQ